MSVIRRTRVRAKRLGSTLCRLNAGAGAAAPVADVGYAQGDERCVP